MRGSATLFWKRVYGSQSPHVAPHCFGSAGSTGQATGAKVDGGSGAAAPVRRKRIGQSGRGDERGQEAEHCSRPDGSVAMHGVDIAPSPATQSRKSTHRGPSLFAAGSPPVQARRVIPRRWGDRNPPEVVPWPIASSRRRGARPQPSKPGSS